MNKSIDNNLKNRFICKSTLPQASPSLSMAKKDNFADMIAQGWVLIYIDNILIFSKDPKEHHEWTVQVLRWLREKDLFLKPEKCIFNAREVEYLGFIVKPNEISMDLMKLAGIKDWIPPKTVKGVRSFLGFGKLLLKIYWQLCGDYQTPEWTHKEDKIFWMVTRMSNSLWKFKEEVPRKTCSHHTRSIKTILHRIWHVQMGYRSHLMTTK